MWVVKRPKVKVILDESLYGEGQLTDGPAFSFYSFKDGKFDPITTRNSEVLIAVTKDQFNSWKNLDIRAFPCIVSIH
jgi:hypothetical protein